MSHLTSLAVAVLTGGGAGAVATELLRHFRERNRDEHDQDAADFAAFRDTWRAEMTRLHDEIDELRLVVVALATELRRHGIDPLPIQMAATRPATNGDHP